jgi:thiol-disulfide isomerase/thioredoxin
MKKIALLIFILSQFAISVTMAQMRFSVIGEISNIPNVANTLNDGDTISLEFTDFSIEKKTVVKNNHFTFNDFISEPTVAMLRFKHGGLKLLLDSSLYMVSIKMKEVGKGKYSYDPTVQTKSEYHNLWDNFYNKYGELSRAKRELLDKRDVSKSSDSLSLLNKKIKYIDSTILRSFKVLAIEHPNNFAVPYIMPDAPDFSYANYIQIYNTLTDNVKSGKRGKRTLEQLNAIKNIKASNEIVGPVQANNLIGKKLPAVGTINEKGQTVFLNAAISKSKFTIIEFWASWCSPCRTINIAMRGKRDALNKAGVNVIGFSFDNDIDNWRKAVKVDNTGWLQVSDLKAQNSPLMSYLSIYNIPTNIVLNADGIIIKKDLYGDEFEKFLKDNVQ